MPQGTCVMRLQNSTSNNVLLTFVNSHVNHCVFNNAPPATVASGATSNNFQLTYNFDPAGKPPATQADFDFSYSTPGEPTNYTASGIIDVDHNGQTVCNLVGAAPGHHTLTGQVGGAAPNFTVLFTFN